MVGRAFALAVVALVAAACSHGSSSDGRTSAASPMPRENGFYACQNMPTGVRDGAGRTPDDPLEFAQRLRRYVRLQLSDLAYRPAFRGCLDAVWSSELGPRPSP